MFSSYYGSSIGDKEIITAQHAVGPVLSEIIPFNKDKMDYRHLRISSASADLCLGLQGNWMVFIRNSPENHENFFPGSKKQRSWKQRI